MSSYSTKTFLKIIYNNTNSFLYTTSYSNIKISIPIQRSLHRSPQTQKKRSERIMRIGISQIQRLLRCPEAAPDGAPDRHNRSNPQRGPENGRGSMGRTLSHQTDRTRSVETHPRGSQADVPV